MYKKGNKILASLIVFIMMMANMTTIGGVIAADISLNTQNSKTNHSNVEFDSYFLDGSKATHDSTKKVNGDNKIVAQISVKHAGYLKDARIEFVDSNYKLIDERNSDKVAKIENNTVTLNQINADENVTIDLPFMFEQNQTINLEQLDKISNSKFTAIYVDENGKEHNIKKDINLELKWTADAEATLTEEVTKYVPYDVNGQKGLIVQMLVKEAVKDNVLPIKESNIEVLVPEINNVKPTEVVVYSEENVEFNYDATNKKATITTKNDADENNQITWSNAEREYQLTYTYPESALSENEVNIQLAAMSNIKIYSYNEKEIESALNETITLKDKIGEIVDTTITSNEALSKGYMYANYNRDEKLETAYTEKLAVNISAPSLVDEMTFNMQSDSFTYEENETTANSYYKNIKMTKAQFNEFFGEEGSIKIYEDTTLLATIDKIIEDENINIELNADSIAIVTSKPIKAGKLTIEFEKALKSDTIYTETQVNTFENINQQANVIVKNDNVEIVSKTINSQIGLVEPVLQSELIMSNTNLSTVVTNQDVEFRSILKTNSEYNKLFKDPVITINLPEYIEKIDIKNIQVLFDDELTLKSWNVENNQIVVELEGTQTKYSIDSVYGGTNIVVVADLTTNNLTPNIQDRISSTVTNENNEAIELGIDINFIAPSGVVAVNKISNLADGQEVMALMNDESATLEVQTSAQTASEEIQVINNYNNKIDNVEILGRTLSQETTNPTTQENLNNTFNVPMLGAIDTNGQENVSVYYSANGSATKDLNNPQNGWTTDVQDFSKVKSYLIQMNDTEMSTGDSIKFNYDMQIPENLNYSQTASSLYTVYFDNVQADQTIGDSVTSRIGTLSTGVAPELQVQLSSNIQENTVVREGQYVKFTATVKNVGTVDAENVKLNITAPSGQAVDSENNVVATYTTKHTEFKEENFFTGYDDIEEAERTIEIGTIKAGKEEKIVFELKIDEIEDLNATSYTDENTGAVTEGTKTEMDMKTTARVIADDMQKEVISNEYSLKVAKGDIKLLVLTNTTTDTVLTKGNKLTYTTKVEQIDESGSTKNVKVRVKVPNGLTIKDANIENIVSTDEQIVASKNIDNTNNIVEFTINELYRGGIVSCNVITEVDNALGIIKPVVTATVGDDNYYSNETQNEVQKVEFTIVQTPLDNSYVKEQKQITFEYVITNKSDVYCSDFTLENIIPEGMKIVSVETIEGDEAIALRDFSEDKLVYERTFKGGQTIKVRVTMQAELLPEGQSQKEIINYATISGAAFETVESNKVKATIEYNKDAYRGEENTPNNPNDPVNPAIGRIISGTAWIDKNQDGQRNDEEIMADGIEVRLLNKNTNEVIATTKTSSSGEYAFTGLAEGEYLVVFLYNSAKYDLTSYKKAGVSQSVNSDVIDVTMNIDGKDRKVGISDTIKLTDSNARNIDIGIVDSTKSDLRLDKYISSITVTYGNEVKTYQYNNEKLAKVEIPANNLSGATVIVEYKIVVTNEGAIGNYIKKIVDYVPSGMKFNSELNRDWYQSTNGDLYNSSLSNVKLLSGESKEVSLTLTKQMNDNNTGIVNNNAELYEVYNEEGTLDIDSTPANKVSSEDDMSSADVVIGVKTGDAVIYTILISTIICAVIGVGTYFIRKKLLTKI